MIKNLKNKLKKNFIIFSLILVIFFTTIATTYFNNKKKINDQSLDHFINNIYLKKTLKEIVNNLEPKYKKYNHKIKSGETFDKILNSYLIDKEQIVSIKKNLLKKTNINKLNTNQKIQITIDQTNNKITEFIFQISNTEKIILSKTKEST